jgi:hypothetical protein
MIRVIAIGLIVLLSGCGEALDNLRERKYEAIPSSNGGIYIVNQDTGSVMHCIPEIAQREIINPYIKRNPSTGEAIPPKKSPPVEPGTPVLKCSTADFIDSQIVEWSSLPEIRKPSIEELVEKYAGDKEQECEVEEVRKIGGATIRFCKEGKLK